MLNILILGYYGRQNWGDDVFEYVFKNYIFKQDNYNLIFKNIDDLDVDTDVYKTIDKVVIGGGDIINNYFFNENNIKLYRKYFMNKPIYFVGVGLTYPQLINIMDIGDYFFMRNKTDYINVKNRYSDTYSYCIPDIAFNLLNESNLENFVKPNKNKKDIKKIGISIPVTWLSDDQDKNNKIIADISETIIELSKTADIHLIPFDTSNSNSNSDILLNNAIQQCIIAKDNSISNVYYMNSSNSDSGKYISNMIEYYKNLDLVICGRFHSVILSMITNTPFVTTHTTTKIENIKNDIPELSEYFIKLDTDLQNRVESFDKNKVISSVNKLMNNYNSVLQKIKTYKDQMCTETLNVNNTLNDLICNNESLVIFRQSPPQYITQEYKDNLIKNTVSNTLKQLFNRPSINNIDNILNGKSILSILKRYKSSELNFYKKILTEEILWTITGDPYAPYYYGLYDKVLSNSFLEQMNWIISDYYENYAYKQTYKNNNITIVNKNFQRLHRSGWQYIVNNIVMQLNNSDKINNPLIIDTYIDKTFHWNNAFYANKKIIPYKNDWIGFIHHTYSDYNNDYNCLELFKEPLFIESLKKCKCLIVMTDYLSEQIKDNLKTLNITNVDVQTIIHPTENTDTMFTWEHFMNNDSKKIIQVGNWLRDVFGIYKVNLPDTSIIKEKSILKNRNSENYFPPSNFIDRLYLELNNKDNTNTSIDICRNSFDNMHMKGLFNCIVEMEESVNTIDFLDNDAYDKLLSKNIVFLHLVDASACNTLIECVMRNTPIIINPIPAVVEILGKDYPLYYKNYYQVSKILDNPSLIKQGYDYLCNIPKQSFEINTFIKQLTDVINKHVN